MTGVIEGGWPFVIAAYTVTAMILGSYAASVFFRHRSEKSRAARERGTGGAP